MGNVGEYFLQELNNVLKKCHPFFQLDAEIPTLCPAGWISPPGLSSCYYFIKTSYSWDEANSACQKSGQLFVIDCEEENKRHKFNLHFAVLLAK